MGVYKQWLLDKVLRTASETALVVLPIKDAEPGYRDVDPGSVAPQASSEARPTDARQAALGSRGLEPIVAGPHPRRPGDQRAW